MENAIYQWLSVKPFLRLSGNIKFWMSNIENLYEKKHSVPEIYGKCGFFAVIVKTIIMLKRKPWNSESAFSIILIVKNFREKERNWNLTEILRKFGKFGP